MRTTCEAKAILRKKIYSPICADYKTQKNKNIQTIDCIEEIKSPQIKVSEHLYCCCS